jgi:hypothetical protein
MQQPLHERTGAKHDGFAPIYIATEGFHADHALSVISWVFLNEQLVGGLLQEGQAGLRFEHPPDFTLVGVTIGLRSGAVHGGPFATIEHVELQGGSIDGQSHGPTQGIDLADDLPFGHTANGRIAAHLGDAVEIAGKQSRFRPQPRSRHRSFRASVAAADDQDIELMRILHGFFMAHPVLACKGISILDPGRRSDYSRRFGDSAFSARQKLRFPRVS